MEKATKQNELYIENVWLRVLVACAGALCLTFVVVVAFGGIRSLDLVAEFRNLPAWGLVLALLLLIGSVRGFFDYLGTKEFILEPGGEEIPKRRKGNFSLTIDHCLSQEEALRRVKLLLAEVKEQHADQIDALEEQWDGNQGTFRLSVKGCSVSGTLTVGQTYVELDGDIPFPASLARGKIAKIIREQARLRLA
ncbi:MAG: polyhydroxyalkanoic acid system family protein [Minisyncoccia bacterium]|jgi:hypothetical protein